MYSTGMISFEFSNCILENEVKLNSSVQFEDPNEVIPCNKFEQITLLIFYGFKYDKHKTVKNVDVTAMICTLIRHGFLPVILLVRT